MSTRRFDCVVTLHTNPTTCGVARFNVELARRLNVPLVPWAQAFACANPLFSYRPDELAGFPPLGAATLVHTTDGAFFNGRPVHCPSAPLPPTNSVGYHTRVFSFGMAHKLLVEPYRALQRVLEPPYAVRLSTAMHEGRPLDEADASLENLRALLGDRLQYLGWLSGYALAEELEKAHYVAAFFPKGVRANNTSVHTAMSRGAVVITNLDAQSPPEYVHGENLLDISQMDALPDIDTWEAIGRAARQTAHGPLGWDALIARLESADVANVYASVEIDKV